MSTNQHQPISPPGEPYDWLNKGKTVTNTGTPQQIAGPQKGCIFQGTRFATELYIRMVIAAAQKMAESVNTFVTMPSNLLLVKKKQFCCWLGNIVFSIQSIWFEFCPPTAKTLVHRISTHGTGRCQERRDEDVTS